MSRPSKPTQLKVIEGNRGKRALNKQEPDPEYVTDLTPPSWLNESASAVWNEIAPHLAHAKLLSKIDTELLAEGCAAMANFRKAHSMMLPENLIKAKMTENDEGQTVGTGEHVNPWMIVQSMSFKQSMAVFQQFGMSPAARSRVAINPQGNLFDGDGKAAAYF